MRGSTAEKEWREALHTVQIHIFDSDYAGASHFARTSASCVDMGKKGKWEEILELEVQDLQNMKKFSAKDLTWTQVFGDQVAVIPYSRFADFIRGEQSIQNAPTHFVVNQERVRQEEEITHSRIDTYLEYAVYWCAYGPESNRKVRNDNKTMSGQVSTKKTRIPRESIKVGCRCHFIMRRLFLKPEHAIIIYTHCRHVDKSNIVCHGKDAIGRPQMFNYAPHLSSDIRAGVEQMIKDGFSVTMIWNKFIYDVEHKSGELFTGLTRDTLMTRQDILNIYHNIKRKEYEKGDGRVHAKKKTMDKKTKFSMQEQRNLQHTLDHGSTYEDALGRVQQSAPYNIDV